MGLLIYVLFGLIFIVDYLLKKFGIENKIMAISPEIIAMILAILVLLYFGKNKGIKVRLPYLFFFAAFSIHITIGLIGNQVQPLAVFAGMRNYLKFLPLYFLPLVYDFQDRQIMGYLKMLLLIAMLEFPLATYQRFVEYAGVATGDYIAGTLEAAPILTIYMICVIAILVGFYLKKKLSRKSFAILVCAAFFPTAINETKATIILLPLAIMVPILIGAEKESRIKIIMTMIPTALILIVAFQLLYKTLYSGRDVLEFYTTGKATDYLYKGAQAETVTGEKETEVGRIDSIVLAYKENSKDLFRLIWGVGIGNAAISFSRKFQGQYTEEYLRLGGKKTGISHFAWEIGWLGILHLIWFFVLAFLDANRVKDKNDISGAIAMGWLGVLVVMAISLPYQNILTKDSIMYPFCFISGYIAAKRYQLDRSTSETAEI